MAEQNKISDDTVKNEIDNKIDIALAMLNETEIDEEKVLISNETAKETQSEENAFNVQQGIKTEGEKVISNETEKELGSEDRLGVLQGIKTEGEKVISNETEKELGSEDHIGVLQGVIKTEGEKVISKEAEKESGSEERLSVLLQEIETDGEKVLIFNETRKESDSEEHLNLPQGYELNAEVLPSQVKNGDYIFLPATFEDFAQKDEWKSSGKWLLFTHGDLEKLDFYWKQLQPLLADGTIVCMKASTATSTEGVVLCYTSDCEDRYAVKAAADAIRTKVDINRIIYYKTNEATDSGSYQKYGNRLITKYMHTVACSLYERDEYKRWKKLF